MYRCPTAAGKQILSARIAMQVLLVDIKAETEECSEDIREWERKDGIGRRKRKERGRSRDIWGKRLTSKPVDWYKRFA